MLSQETHFPINDFRVMKIRHQISEYYPPFRFKKNLHWSAKLECDSRGYNWQNVPNHPKKGGRALVYIPLNTEGGA